MSVSRTRASTRMLFSALYPAFSKPKLCSACFILSDASSKYGIPGPTCGCVRQLALAVVERSLAAPDTPEVEPQHRKVPVHESIVHLVDDLMVHRAAELRMGMQHDADRGILLAGRVIPALDAPGRAGEDDLGHEFLDLDSMVACDWPRTNWPHTAQCALDDNGGCT